MELENLLKEYFEKSKKSHQYEEIKKELKIKGEKSENILKDALTKLIENGTIIYSKKGYSVLPYNSAFGEININKQGTGFVHTNNGTILIEKSNLNGVLDGDTIIVSDIIKNRKDYYSGKVSRIIKRKTGNVVLEVIKENNKISFKPYHNEIIEVEVVGNIKNLLSGDLILVEVDNNPINGIFKGSFKKIIGHKDDPDVDIKEIFERNNIPTDFNNNTIEETKKIPTFVSSEEINGRVDLRNEKIFTIDCDETKDRDDSVGIKKLDNGNYLLKVNISHVSHYIKPGMSIFEEAIIRCSSHYLGSSCNPMLPRTISNGICSLNAHVDRLARTIEMEIDENGNVVNYNIYNSVINSKCEMCYSKVNELLSGKSNDYDLFEYDLRLMLELNNILQRVRKQRGYLDFNVSEVQNYDNNGINDFKALDHGISGQMIENFMLIANVIVYKHLSWFILAYRIHEGPNADSVRKMVETLRKSGLNVPRIQNVNAHSIKKILDTLDNSDVSLIIRENLLRTMKKACYSTENIGHFALQYDIYGHATSPIRRIIDLITHMTLDNIDTFDYSEKSYKEFECFLKEICERANRIERLGKSMERECEEMQMAEYMENHIGEEFEVIITEIDHNAIFVRTSNLIRGKIKLEDIDGDKFYFDEDSKSIKGRNTNIKYQIGNTLNVILKEASKINRTINFKITKQKIKKLN